MRSTILKFGRYKGQSLEQVLFRDPDYFFYVYGMGWLATYEPLATELAKRARHIKIPKPDPENWRVGVMLKDLLWCACWHWRRSGSLGTLQAVERRKQFARIGPLLLGRPGRGRHNSDRRDGGGVCYLFERRLGMLSELYPPGRGAYGQGCAAQHKHSRLVRM
jgi:hypothetical protein